MKKYQLIGRKKVPFGRRKTSYPPLHLCSLPYEVLSQIFSYLSDEIHALLSLAATCSKFNTIVSKAFLYRNMVFTSPSSFAKFAAAHLPQKTSLTRRFVSAEPSGKINFITSVHIVNPPTHSNTNKSTNIAGSYAVDTSDTASYDYEYFVKNLRSLLNEAWGLKEVRISEISPQFAFPPDLLAPQSSLSLKSRPKSPAQNRCLENLVLSAQSGWTIPFKVQHVSLFLKVFDHISLLTLNSFAIHENKLDSEGTQHMAAVHNLVLSSCIYTDTKKCHKRKRLELLSQTTSLGLSSIQHAADLSLIDVVKANEKLSRLSIDVSSRLFYHVDPADNTSKFNFSRYNNFFKLVCSGEGGYSKLKEVVLTNFDLFHTISHKHSDKPLDVIQEEQEDECEDQEVEESTTTFESFMKYLSAIPYLTIIVKEAPSVMHTCVNCGFTVKEETKSIPSLRYHEWCVILQPILHNRKCSVTIFDHRLQPLFTRRALA